jgi:hypothetical protein
LTAALTDNKGSHIPRKSDNNTSGPQSIPPKFSIESESPDFWTLECFVDKIFLRLVEVKETVHNEGKEIHVKKYYRQAREKFQWISIAKPSPAFIIYISDLTQEIKTQIEQLMATSSPDNLRYVLTQAVGRIFENLDFEYYHLSIARNLRVRIEK